MLRFNLMLEDYEKKIIKGLFLIILAFFTLSAGYFMVFDRPGKSEDGVLGVNESKTDLKVVDLYGDEIEIDRPSLIRRYPKTIKSVHAKSLLGFEELLFKRGELVAIGANTIRVSPAYRLVSGEFVLIGDKRFYENAVRILKNEGFAVILSITFLDPISEPYASQLLSIAAEWGRVAEDYKVEYFLPLDLDHRFLIQDSYTTLIKSDFSKSLSEASREVFSGKLLVLVNFAGIGFLDDYPLDLFDFALVDYRLDLGEDTENISDFELGEIYSNYFPKVQKDKGVKIIHLLNLRDDYRRAKYIRGRLRAYGSLLGGIDVEYIHLTPEARREVIDTLSMEISTEDSDFFSSFSKKYKFDIKSVKDTVIVLDPKAENIVENQIDISGKYILQSVDRMDIFGLLETKDGEIVTGPEKLGVLNSTKDWKTFNYSLVLPAEKPGKLIYLKVYLGDSYNDSRYSYSVPLFLY